jgi:hypothetical protein
VAAEVRTVVCKNNIRQNVVRCLFLPVGMYMVGIIV